MDPAPRRRRRQRLLSVALGLAAGLAAGEAWARATRPAPLPERLPILRVQSNPLRGWEMVPGEDHFTYQHPVAINALGLRGAELGPKAPGELRVLALGDSLVYGQGVAGDQTLPHHLEAILNERVERPVRVVNGGLRAYATHQQLGLLRELGDVVAPDLVVLFWYWNDVDERDLEHTAQRLADSGPIAFDIGHAPEGLPLFKWRFKQLVRRSALAMLLNDQLRAVRDPYPWQLTAAQDVERLDGYLAEFGSECERLGARFVMATIPPAAALAGPHPSVAISLRALEIAEARGVPVVALGSEVTALIERGGALPVVPYDGHYDGEGNRLLATEAARFLATLPWFE